MAMMMQRTSSPARWQAALARAIADGVQVRQLAGSGAWVATSGTDAATAYGLDVVNGMAHGCDCPAAQHGDPICKHRSAYYHAAGLLDPEPEPVPPAPILRVARPICADCDGQGFFRRESITFASVVYRVTCQACRGSGAATSLPLPRAAESVALRGGEDLCVRHTGADQDQPSQRSVIESRASSSPYGRCWTRRNAATTSGSNCLPACSLSSLIAWSGDQAVL